VGGRRAGGIIHAVTFTWSLAWGAPLTAQVDVTADVALGAVKYEGFLGSAAVSFTPAVRYDGRFVSAAAQGNYLLYESGRSLTQGAGAVAFLSPSLGPLRGEVSGFGGISSYAGSPVSGYGMARARMHVTRGARGIWIGAGLGGSYAAFSDARASELATGGWMLLAGTALTVTAAYSHVADTTYADLSATVRWTWSAIEVDALLGARPWSKLAHTGAFADVAARVWLTSGIAAQVTAGTYLSDPMRTGVPGRYVAAGVRIAPFSHPRADHALDERLRSQLRLPTAPADRSLPTLTVERAGIGASGVTILAPLAKRVEIAADFTDWQAVALTRAGGNRWRLNVMLAPGVYRLNVRLDGGAWTVPRGLTVQDDEFGGRVGLVVIQ
jgi:hypothetical protein